MSTELRLKLVEERVMEHTQLIIDMRQGLLQFEGRVDRRFELIDSRLASLDLKIDAIGDRLERRIDVLAVEMTKHFRWTAGLMLTGLIAIAAAILAS